MTIDKREIIKVEAEKCANTSRPLTINIGVSNVTAKGSLPKKYCYTTARLCAGYFCAHTLP